MFKKLSCGLLALTMAFSSTPALFDGNFASVGVVDVEAGELKHILLD